MSLIWDILALPVDYGIEICNSTVKGACNNLKLIQCGAGLPVLNPVECGL
nr:MAG TPA: hypothetical protein [Bacteriophage sp.]